MQWNNLLIAYVHGAMPKQYCIGSTTSKSVCNCANWDETEQTPLYKYTVIQNNFHFP